MKRHATVEPVTVQEKITKYTLKGRKKVDCNNPNCMGGVVIIKK